MLQIEENYCLLVGATVLVCCETFVKIMLFRGLGIEWITCGKFWLPSQAGTRVLLSTLDIERCQCEALVNHGKNDGHQSS